MATNSSGPRIRKALPSKKTDKAGPKDSKKRLQRLAPKKLFRLFGFLGFLRPVGRAIKKVMRWVTPRYFINSWKEVRQVTWPSRKETWRLTLAVFIFAIVFGLLIAGVDKVLNEIFKNFILR